MKRLIITSLVIGIALLGLQAQASANLLTDPSFESYSGAWTPLDWGSTPWFGGGGAKSGNSVGGFSSVVNEDAYTGMHSVKMLQFGLSGDPTFWSYALLGQQIVVNPNTTYSASAVAKRLGDLTNSQAYLKVTWLNNYGDEGASADSLLTSKLSNSNAENQWVTLNKSFTSPGYAVGAKVMVIFDRAPTNIDPADILVDDVSFDGGPIPEPASLLLLGSGLVGLLGLGKKKRA